jgi:hypothetical protein
MDTEVHVFIFNRPFRAVAAGITVSLLTVLLDRSCQADEGPPAHSAVISCAKRDFTPPLCGRTAYLIEHQ